MEAGAPLRAEQRVDMSLASEKLQRGAIDDAARNAWRRIGGQLGEIASGAGERSAAQRNAILAFTVRVASAAILFLSQVAIARWMGGYEYGAYVYAWTIVLVLGGLSTLGLNVAVIRLVPHYRETGELAALRGLLLGSRMQTFAIAVLASVVVALVLWTFAAALPIGNLWPLWLALLAVPAYALSDVQDGICRGSARMVSATFPPYILRPLLILAGIGAIHAAGLPLAAASAVAAAVLATWLAWGVQLLIVQRRVLDSVPKGDCEYRFGAWFKTSLPLLAICACELALQNTDVIVISHLLSPMEAGIYFAAAKTMGLIMFVYYAVGSAMANRFAAISARGDAAALQATVRDAVRWTFWPSLAVGLAMLAAGRPLLSLFGPQFADGGYPVMCVLILAFLARAAIGPVDFLLNMSGGQAACARSLMIAALLNLVLDLLLVPVAGIMGAALAVALSLVAGAVLNYRAACRRLGFDIGIWAALGKL